MNSSRAVCAGRNDDRASSRDLLLNFLGFRLSIHSLKKGVENPENATLQHFRIQLGALPRTGA
jgi:hypothetical protein